MAFSPDGRLLAAQGGAPEWNLVLWVWEKSKVVTSVKTTNAAGNPVYQVSSTLLLHCLHHPLLHMQRDSLVADGCAADPPCCVCSVYVCLPALLGTLLLLLTTTTCLICRNH